MNHTPAKSMIIAGVMSGTSADGVDVALCRISPPNRPNATPTLKLLGHRAFPYDTQLREAVLSAMSAKKTTAADFARLSWRLGEVYAECIATTARELKRKPQLIACHGQTIYHQATPANFLGKPLRCTWQIGEPAVIAEKLRIPVISDFRPADLAAAGQGAPLVPMLDFCLFRHATKNRILLNLGGIANLTALPAASDSTAALAFDTGPANMVIDACTQTLYGRPFDANGKIASTGRVHQTILAKLLRAPYFSAPPPKSCGREEFGFAFTTRFLALCQRERLRKQDILATATAFTAATILDAYRRFCWPHLGQRAPLARATEVIAAGGGARNATLMHQLTKAFAQLGVTVTTTASSGLPPEAKEAAAFALLGWLTWNHLPGNIPSATGALHPAILGKVSLP